MNTDDMKITATSNSSVEMLKESTRRETMRQFKEYKYFILYDLSFNLTNSNLLKLQKLSLCDGAYNSTSGMPIFHDGPHEFFGIHVRIVDRHKNGKVYFYFKTKQEAQEFEKHIITPRRIEPINGVYELTSKGWSNNRNKKYTMNTRHNLIGYHSYVEKIIKDITNSVKYNEFLTTLGERRTLNYLLYGPPGVGKTTLIKTLATECNLPMYVVKGSDLSNFDVSYILNPTCGFDDITKFRILVFEDFDRYLELHTAKFTMADVLNAMDGVVSEIPVVRFFTGNNCDVIFRNTALISRITSKFKFTHPPLSSYVEKLNKFLTFYSPKQIDPVKLKGWVRLIETVVVPRHISLRSFSSYVARYLFEDNYLDAYVENIDELLPVPEELEGNEMSGTKRRK